MLKIKLDFDHETFGFIQYQIGDWTSPKMDVLQAHDAYSRAVATSEDAAAVWAKWREYLGTFDFPVAELSTAALASIAERVVEKTVQDINWKPTPAVAA